jgi:tetratricopeptide (TPR) repeat protein
MKNSLLLILLILLLNSCGNYVTVKVMRPSEISTAQYKKAAIGNVFANNSRYNDVQNFRSILTTELQKKKRFQILDTKLGVPSSNETLIINVNILNSEYKEEITIGEEYKDKKGTTHRDQRRIGKHTLSVNYTLNTSMGAYIGEKSTQKEEETSTTETDKAPPSINSDQLVLDNIRYSVMEFLKSIIPYEEPVSVELMDDKSIPDLKKGIEAAENGFWDIAITHFTRATQASKNPFVHYAHYNLGVAYLYSYDFANARIHLRKALEIKGNESAYKRMYQELDRMERDEIV